MGTELIVGLALTAVSSALSVAGSLSAASQQAKAVKQAVEAQYDELTRQQQEAVDAAEQQKGDRARQADRELATLRVIAGETGGLGTVTSARLEQEAMFFEGLDLARIEANKRRTVDNLQKAKENASANARSQIKSIRSKANFSALGAIASGVGTGIQIYSREKAYERIMESRKGKID